MLIPRRTKHRKQHRPDRSGAAKGGTRVTFGEYGIQALEHSYVSNRQIEAARIAMTRHIRRGGKVWITIYPDRPLTKKPAETRMGAGEGAAEWGIANVKRGRVMFELSGVPEPIAREALRRAMHKLPMKCRFVKRELGEAGWLNDWRRPIFEPRARKSWTTSWRRRRSSCSICASRPRPASWRATDGSEPYARRSPASTP